MRVIWLTTLLTESLTQGFAFHAAYADAVCGSASTGMTTPCTSGRAANDARLAITSAAAALSKVSPSRCWFTRITVARSDGNVVRSGITPATPPVREYAAQVGVFGGSTWRTRSTY